MPSPATHLFIAMNTIGPEIEEKDQLQYLIGSIFPDIEGLLYKKPVFNHKPVIEFAEYLSQFPEYKFFVKGINTHILSDNPAHTGYVLKKIKLLSKTSEIDPGVIHGLVELALDLELLRMHPELSKLTFNNKVFKKAGLEKISEHMATFMNIEVADVNEALERSFEVLNIKTINSWLRLAKIYVILNKYLKLDKEHKKGSLMELNRTLKKAQKTVKKDYKRFIDKVILSIGKAL